jgi:hypothetical protein
MKARFGEVHQLFAPSPNGRNRRNAPVSAALFKPVDGDLALGWKGSASETIMKALLPLVNPSLG